jgi:hypothetical protein
MRRLLVMNRRYQVEVTVGPEEELAAYLHLSLHGIPPLPQKEVSAQKRADAWYAKILERSHGYKFVAIDDEMIFKVRSRLFTHLAHIPMLHL